MSESLGINEWEALAFFEADPVSTAHGETWEDSDSVYEVNQSNGLSLTCAIHPIYRDVRLRLLCNDELVLEWHAQGLSNIWYTEEKDGNYIKFSSSDDDYTILRVKPLISITRSSNISK